MPDSHPADKLIDDIRGLFNGSTFVNAVRDAFDRHFGPSTSQPDSDNPVAAAQTKANDDKAVQDATASFRQPALNMASAAKIRKMAGKQ